MIQAQVIADSKNEFGNRITTMVVTFPRYILAELNTHRMLSKNSASSRAIPFEKLLKSVRENPFIPIAFQKNHTGMQGTEYFKGEEGKPADYEADIKLHDRLASSGHWSPFEHCAKAMNGHQAINEPFSGNFKGFIQYRKTFANENIT